MSFKYEYGDDLAFLTPGLLETEDIELLARNSKPMTRREWEERYETICD